jgi:predicted 3-demethylubiquinone-9 3-methyltransferase (glyoxalase superfamily)
MQNITPFLWFNANAEEAVNFYVSLFPDSKIVETSRWGDSGPLPKGTLLSTTFELQGQRFMAMNAGQDRTYSEAISFFVDCKTQEEVDRYWHALREGGTPQPCGWLKDKYGVSWQIIPSILGKLMNDEDPAKAGRVVQAMLKMKKIDIAELKRAYEG